MKTTVKKLRSMLSALVREMGRTPERYARNPRSDFTRRRKLGLEGMMAALLCLGGGSLGQELLDRFGQGAPSVSAFVQQRQKLLPQAMEHLFHAFTDSLDTKGRRRGCRLLAVDGTSLKSAPYPGDPDSYLPGSQYQHGWNQFHLNALFDLERGLYVDALVQKERKKNEGAALRAMQDRSSLEGPVILLADRNYESYNNLAHLKENGWSYVIRAKDGGKGIVSALELPTSPEFVLPVCISITRKNSREFQILRQTEPNRYRFLPSTCTFDYLEYGSGDFYDLSFRVVRLRLPDGSFETLLTDLDLPPDRLKRLYARRWGIETSFRQLKYTVGLLHLHAKKPDLVLQEIFSMLTVYNFSQAAVKAAVSDQERKQSNFATAVHLCRRLLQGELSLKTVLAALPKSLLPVSRPRSFPRPILAAGRISLFYRMA